MSKRNPKATEGGSPDATDRTENLDGRLVTLAHQLRQPLGAIANYADLATLLVQEEPDANRQKLLAALEAIAREVDRAGRIVGSATERADRQDDGPGA